MSLYTSRAQGLADGERELRELRARQAALDDEVLATRRALARAEAGDAGDPQAHLRRPHRPLPPADARLGLAVELWSALSVALLLGIGTALVWLDVMPWWGAVSIVLAGYVVAEAAFRRRLTVLMLRLTVLLAVVAIFLILWQVRFQAILLLVAGLALLLFVDNVREIRRR